VVEKNRIRGTYAILRSILSRYQDAKTISIIYEAGFSGYWLYRKLTKDGYRCFITPPNLTPNTSSKVKTDKRDAEKLALYHIAGILKYVTVPSRKAESNRRVIRCRRQISKKRIRAKQQIRSFLNLHGIKRPESIKTNWSKKYISWLESLSFEYESDNFHFAKLLRDFHHHHKELVEVNLFLRQLSKSEDYQKNFKLLTSTPGVGLITGMTFLLELFDFARFSSAEKFASYLGLTPSQYSTGEHIRLGHITRQGNADIRRVLVESAWTLIRHDPHLKEKYDRIRSRGENGKKAIVAVARCMAIRLRRGLLDGTGYVIGTC
jgi:transposase